MSSDLFRKASALPPSLVTLELLVPFRLQRHKFTTGDHGMCVACWMLYFIGLSFLFFQWRFFKISLSMFCFGEASLLALRRPCHPAFQPSGLLYYSWCIFLGVFAWKSTKLENRLFVGRNRSASGFDAFGCFVGFRFMRAVREEESESREGGECDSRAYRAGRRACIRCGSHLCFLQRHFRGKPCLISYWLIFVFEMDWTLSWDGLPCDVGVEELSFVMLASMADLGEVQSPKLYSLWIRIF